MGRTRTKNQLRAKLSLQNAQTSKAENAPSLSALLEKAQSLIVQCDFELAVKFARRILELDLKNAEAKEMLGVSLLEMGDIAAAKKTFQELIQQSSTSPPPSAHLYLAQLNEDDPKAALQHYQAAVNILMAQLKGKVRAEDNDSTDESEIKTSIVRALIGQVEIWMDPSYDLCFEPEAEKTCEDLLMMALQMDPGNAEALQTLASVRMSQQRPEEAKQYLEQAWSSWKDLDLDDAKIPPIPSRLSLVKLFIELSLYTPALLVVHGIMSSDDQEVEAWYLEGWCFYLMAEHAQEDGGTFDDLTWQELAKDSRDCLETCQVLHRNQDHPDKPILEHVKELILKLDSLGISASPLVEDDDDDNAGDGDEEWETDDEGLDGDGDVDMK